MPDEQRETLEHSRRWLVRTAAGLLVAGGIAGVGIPVWAASDDDHDDDRYDDDHDKDDDHSGHGGGDDDDHDRNDDRDDDRDDDDDDRRGTQETRPPGSVAHVVEILDEAFVPATITINVGEWVTWDNRDDDEHTATGRDFDTGELERGDSADIQFNTPGSFPYVCQFHAEMTAEVIVIGDATPEASPDAVASPVASGNTVTVSMVDFAFDPLVMNINVGDAVIWSNDGEAPHTATGETFDTDVIAPGEEGSIVFDSAGTFEYVCAFHPQMTGTINVNG